MTHLSELDIDRVPGFYIDSTTGDMWHYGKSGWYWVNGNKFRFIPRDNLVLWRADV